MLLLCYCSYQIKSANNLARLYSTSTMEHHHFDQCLMLLSSHGNQLLANVSKVTANDPSAKLYNH